MYAFFSFDATILVNKAVHILVLMFLITRGVHGIGNSHSHWIPVGFPWEMGEVLGY